MDSISRDVEDGYFHSIGLFVTIRVSGADCIGTIVCKKITCTSCIAGIPDFLRMKVCMFTRDSSNFVPSYLRRNSCC